MIEHEPPKKLISSKIIFFFGFVAITLVIAGGVQKEMETFEWPGIPGLPSNPLVDLISGGIETASPSPNEVGSVLNGVYAVSVLPEHISASGAFVQERGVIAQRTDCNKLMDDFNRYPDYPLRPTIAKQILAVCSDQP